MESLLIEGISQSGVDSRLPTVAVERRLKVFLEDRLSTVAPEQSQLLLAEPGSDLTVFETLRRSSTKPSAKRNGKPRGIEHIVLAVGPEGGWMPREASMFEEMFGFQRVSLGDRILRTDAAVLILLGLLHEFIRVAESDSSTLRHDELKDNISQTF